MDPGATDTCQDFNDGTGAWKGSLATTHGNEFYPPKSSHSGASGMPEDYSLEGHFKAPGQILFNDYDFKGNLLEQGNYLSFDFRVRNIRPEWDLPVSPKLYFYIGSIQPERYEIKILAVFHFDREIVSNDGWVHFSMPLTPTPNKEFPESQYGQWEIVEDEARHFAKVMTEANGIFFDLTMKDVPEAIYEFDNVCLEFWDEHTDGRSVTDPQEAEEEEIILSKIYPNPGYGTFNVSLEKPASGTLEIFGVTGNPVHRQAFKNEKELKFDITGKTKGMYIARLIIDGQKPQNIQVVLK